MGAFRLSNGARCEQSTGEIFACFRLPENIGCEFALATLADAALTRWWSARRGSAPEGVACLRSSLWKQAGIQRWASERIARSWTFRSLAHGGRVISSGSWITAKPGATPKNRKPTSP